MSATEPGADEIQTEQVRRTLSYHRRTKHHLHRYAQSLGYLDWKTQPDPFRVYAGAPAVDLPLLADALNGTYADLYVAGRLRPRRVDLTSVAVLFELSLGLSAWKEYKGERWALRCNPSSGNLHPTEGYAVLPTVSGLSVGVYHYVSRDHRLERRCTLSAGGAAHLTTHLPSDSFLIGLSSVHWREAWKYGERAFRYCQHDVGHALAAIRFAAAALGWSALLLQHPGDADVSALLGLAGSEAFAGIDPLDGEHPDALLLVGPTLLAEPSLDIPAILKDGTWSGTANPLSSDHVHWEVIDDVAGATLKSRGARVPATVADPLPPLLASPVRTAATLIRQRRSCLSLDGKTTLPAETFFAMLDHLLPRPGIPPWDLLPWRPCLHAGLFVHRVDGLVPGLYLFERHPEVHEQLTAACHRQFLWRRPQNCPEHLRLFLLAEGDAQARARQVSCHQEIASDGAFASGMIAEFGDSIRRHGAWWYRRLFWESGVLGQVLYLEAEAAGVRSTGIGCYFDDVFHELLGLKGDTFQSLYHFTVGGPVEDPRLRTIAPYAHLSGR